MQDLYKQVLYSIKKPILVFFLILFISPIVIAKEYTQDYNNPVTYSMGDLRWCRLYGICTFDTITTEAIITKNLSVIGEVFNVTMNLVSWNITDDFNVGGNLEAKNITVDCVELGGEVICSWDSVNTSVGDIWSIIDNGTFVPYVGATKNVNLGNNNNFTVDGSTFTIDTTAGIPGVGIGAAPIEPNTKLHVQVDAGSSNLPSMSFADIILEDTSGANDGATFSMIGGAGGESTVRFGDTDDENSGEIMYDHLSDSFNISTNGGKDKLIIDSSGNVMIKGAFYGGYNGSKSDMEIVNGTIFNRTETNIYPSNIGDNVIIGTANPDTDEKLYVEGNVKIVGSASCISSVANHYTVTDNGDNTCTVVFQPDATYGMDAPIYGGGGLENTNYGTTANDWMGKGTGYEKRFVIKFDVSSVIPDVTIISANLSIYASSDSNDPYTGVFYLTTDWDEGTITWNNPWGTPGGDFNTTALSTNFNPGTSWMDFGVKQTVQSWTNGGISDYGFMLKGNPVEISHFVSYYTSDYATPANRPILNITYEKPSVPAVTIIGDTNSTGHLIPGDNNTYNLGRNNTGWWKNAWVNNIFTNTITAYGKLTVAGNININNNSITDVYCINFSNGDTICGNSSIDVSINGSKYFSISDNGVRMFDDNGTLIAIFNDEERDFTARFEGSMMNNDNINDTSRFVERNLNNGSGASSALTVRNDIPYSASFGLTSSRFSYDKIGSNVAGISSVAPGEMVFMQRYNYPIIWYINKQNDSSIENLSEVMRLDEDGLNVSDNLNVGGNITGNRIYGNLNRGGNATTRPSSVNVSTGTLVSGNITSIQEIDGDVLEVTEVTGTPGYDIIVNYTNFLGTPRRIEYVGRYQGITAHNVEIRIFNYSSGSYGEINDEIGDIPSSSENLALSFMIEGNLSDFVSDGVVSIQVIHTSNGVTSHKQFMDFLTVTSAQYSIPDVGQFVKIDDYGTSSDNGVKVDSVSGNMTILIPGSYRTEVSSSFVGDANSFLLCSIFKNDIQEITLRFVRRLNTGGDIASASLGKVLDNLEVNDVLDLRCASEIENSFVTFTNLDFYIERVGN